MLKRIFRWFLAALAALLSFACGGSHHDPQPPPPEPTTVVISGTTAWAAQLGAAQVKITPDTPVPVPCWSQLMIGYSKPFHGIEIEVTADSNSQFLTGAVNQGGHDGSIEPITDTTDHFTKTGTVTWDLPTTWVKGISWWPGEADDLYVVRLVASSQMSYPNLKITKIRIIE